ncbi:MAG: two-component sensor histidine kinase [Methylobacteriaceae bacterium]|nr:two-component sensor histidine kinase [Methylobacteriaceae bacterium]MBV9705308.1 two-component sensor histidine kinase [Methylobacteriaceae bacterium]
MSLSLVDTLQTPRSIWRSASRWLARRMPKGLFARSLLIVVAPMLLLQAFVVLFFMDRYWQLVTYRLSAALTQDIAAIIDIHKNLPNAADEDTLERIAGDRMGLDIEFLPKQSLPPALPKPFFSLLDSALSTEISRQIGRPFWIDTVGRSSLIEIRILLDDGVLRIMTRRSAAYASNSHIFILWMVGTSSLLLLVAILFLRNQIRPILRLVRAAEDFGKGRFVEFRPGGAREVRQAGFAFIEMKRRIDRAIEQRTAMLNGVSHDLRTILTRFKLSLALIGEGPDSKAMEQDIDEMQRMLEAYLAFARGDSGEPAAPTDMRRLLQDLKRDAERHGHATGIELSGDPTVTVRPDAFKRCVANLVANAQRHGDRIALQAVRDGRFLTIHVDDDGPGIPPDKREDVFRPFFRLDEARNQDEGGTGLGLAIARDVARAHGGDITLADSPLGGLRATVRVPV